MKYHTSGKKRKRSLRGYCIVSGYIVKKKKSRCKKKKCTVGYPVQEGRKNKDMYLPKET